MAVLSMGIFQNNILKPEELIGSFEPFADGDDTFALNTMGEYPGDLPDFDFFESLVPPKPNIPLDVEPTLEVESPQQENDGVWEMFEDNPQLATNETVSTNDIDSLFSNANQDFSVDDEQETENPYVQQDFSNDQELDSAIIDDDDKLEQMLRDAMNDEQDESSSDNSLDTELSSVNIEELFNDDLTPSPAIPQSKTETVVAEAPIVVDNMKANSEFQDIEGIAGTVVIDINNVYPTHPSKTGIDEPTQIPIQDNIPNPEAKPKKVKVKKPINKKLVRRITYFAAALLLLAGTGLGVYYSGLIGTVNNWIASSKHSDSTSVVKDIKKPEIAVHKELPTVKETEKKGIDTIQKSNAEVKATPVQHSEPVATVAPKEVKTEPVAKELKIKKLPKAIAKTEIHKEKIIKETKPEHKTIATTKVPSNKSVNKPINTVESKPETEVYVIQIYASPSKEDAQEWLRKIQKRIGAEAYISTQVVRDKIWYRVRCGHYTSKESATAAAVKYGYSQSWVDRIK